MAEAVRFEISDGVARIGMDRAPANGLVAQMRAGLLQALERAQTDDSVRAVVLHGLGQVFSSGLDISEYDHKLEAPDIATLCAAVENCTKPVVAALHGQVMGAAFDLALACHSRVAQLGTRLAYPEITLGLIPSGGGTQRLPRILGAEVALSLLMEGQPVTAEDPRLAPLFFRVQAENTLETAEMRARAMAGDARLNRTCERVEGLINPGRFQAAVRKAEAALDGRSPRAKREVIRAVEAAQLLPFEQGAAYEGVVAEELRLSPPARAARHAYIAERRTVPAALAQLRVAPIRRVAILGVQGPASQIAVACLDQGAEVMLVSPAPAPLKLIRSHVLQIYEKAVARGRLPEAGRDERMNRLSATVEPSDLTQAELIFDLGGVDVPKAAVPEGTLWAVLSERGDPARQVARTQPLAQVFHMRAYTPIHLQRPVELHPVAHADEAGTARLTAFLRRMRKPVVFTGAGDELLGHAWMAGYYAAAVRLLDLGVPAAEIEAGGRALGFAHGPLRMIDLEGVALVAARLERMAETRGWAGFDETSLLSWVREEVSQGQGEDRGFYLYDGEAEPVINPMIEGAAAEMSFETTAVLDGLGAEAALQAALVNSAGRMLDEKRARQAGDMDVLACRGYAFRPDLGGPLIQADIKGLFPIRQATRKLALLDAGIWGISATVDRLVKNGEGFFGRFD